MNIQIWIHQNVIKTGKQFGIDFQGFEEEAQQLLMKIDQKKKASKGKANMILDLTLKIKGVKELKRLEFGHNFKSYGTRSGWGFHININ